MEVLGLIIGSIVGVLTAVTLSLALWRRNIAAMRSIVLETLVFVGLVTQKGVDGENAWPNGSDSLPEFLHTLWASLEATQAQLHLLVSRDKGEES